MLSFCIDLRIASHWNLNNCLLKLSVDLLPVSLHRYNLPDRPGSFSSRHDLGNDHDEFQHISHLPIRGDVKQSRPINLMNSPSGGIHPRSYESIAFLIRVSVNKKRSSNTTAIVYRVPYTIVQSHYQLRTLTFASLSKKSYWPMLMLFKRCLK